jgi:glutaredoxin
MRQGAIRGAAAACAGALLALALLLIGVAALSPHAHAATGAGGPVLEVFVREGCNHCEDAKRFLADFAPTRPGLSIVYRDIDADEANMDALAGHARAAGRAYPAVPTFVVDRRVMIGFVGADFSGPALAALIDGAGADSPRSGPPGRLDPVRLGLPLFSLAMGLLDGINPCAMWALLFLLSMLVHLRDRGRIALLAASFVGASAAIHFAMLAAWLNVFALAGVSSRLQPVAGTVGVVLGLLNIKDFFAPGRGPSLSIPASAKPGLGARIRAILATRSTGAAIAAVLTLAVLVNLTELLCTAGFPAIYSAALTRLAPGPVAAYGYLAVYMTGYLLPSTVLAIGAVVLLSSPHLTTGAGRWLKLASGVAMLGLALSMLLPGGWPNP